MPYLDTQLELSRQSRAQEPGAGRCRGSQPAKVGQRNVLGLEWRPTMSRALDVVTDRRIRPSGRADTVEAHQNSTSWPAVAGKRLGETSGFMWAVERRWPAICD